MTEKTFLAAVEDEVERSRREWSDLDQTNTTNDFVALALAYVGRATSARRNTEDKVACLVKGCGLLVRAAEKLEAEGA